MFRTKWARILIIVLLSIVLLASILFIVEEHVNRYSADVVIEDGFVKVSLLDRLGSETRYNDDTLWGLFVLRDNTLIEIYKPDIDHYDDGLWEVSYRGTDIVYTIGYTIGDIDYDEMWLVKADLSTLIVLEDK